MRDLRARVCVPAVLAIGDGGRVAVSGGSLTHIRVPPRHGAISLVSEQTNHTIIVACHRSSQY